MEKKNSNASPNNILIKSENQTKRKCLWNRVLRCFAVASVVSVTPWIDLSKSIFCVELLLFFFLISFEKLIFYWWIKYRVVASLVEVEKETTTNLIRRLFLSFIFIFNRLNRKSIYASFESSGRHRKISLSNIFYIQQKVRLSIR